MSKLPTTKLSAEAHRALDERIRALEFQLSFLKSLRTDSLPLRRVKVRAYDVEACHVRAHDRMIAAKRRPSATKKGTR